MVRGLGRQRGFLLNPFRFGAGGGGGGGGSAAVLLHFDGPDGSDTITDNGVNGLSIAAVGTAGAIQTEQSRFGGASLGALAVRHAQGEHASVAFGTSDFTVEGFVYWVSAVAADNRGIWQVCTPAAGPHASNTNLAAFVNNAGLWTFYTGMGVTVTSSLPVTVGVWHHVAMARQSGTLRIFVGGAEVSSLADSTSYAGTGFAVGTYYSSAFRVDGYVDEFRITAGTALYTANFTPPSSPFPDA